MKTIKLMKTNKKLDWQEYRFQNVNFIDDYFISIFKDKRKKLWSECLIEKLKEKGRYGEIPSYEMVNNFEEIIKFIEKKLDCKIEILNDLIVI